MATDILIVEDESIVALDLENHLTSMGFHVVGRVGTGRAALEIVEHTPPDVVLMDIQLRGDLDGISTADRIQESYDIPVIFLTAFSDSGSLERVKRSNAYGYLLKPFQERELSIAVELALYKHRAEREIREGHALLDITLSAVSEAVITANRNDQILFMNEAAERLTGWRMAEATGTDLSSVVDVEATDRLYTSTEQWTRLTPRGGTPRTVAISSRDLDRPSSSGAARVVVIRDVTQEQEYRDNLLAAKEAAESATQAKSDFLTRVTHELRTPLNSILGMTSLLRPTADSEVAGEYMDILEQSSQQLSGLISDILDYARIDTERFSLHHELVDPVRLVERVSRSFAVEAARKGVRVITVIDPVSPRAVYSDEARLVQIVRNLVSNAVKFTAAGYVMVSLGPGAEDTIVIRVSDTGPGVPEKYSDVIFEDFSQVENPATRTAGGVGLGLTLVRRLITVMGGTVELLNSSSEGATFSVELPFTPAEQHPHSPVDTSPTVSSVVTDDELIARAWNPWCEFAGVQLSCVPWDEISSNPMEYEVVITGEEHARELSENTSVVVVSSLRDRREPSASRENTRTVIIEPSPSDEIFATLHATPENGKNGRDTKPLSPEAHAKSGALTVLVVDDDASNLVVQRKLLEAHGHRVTTAGTGEKALAALRNGSFDAAILDIEMPDIDGWKLAELIRSGEGGEAGMTLPLVALSAHDSREITPRAKTVGFAEVLTKPVQVETVTQVLDTIVGGQSPTRSERQYGSVPAAEIRQAIRAGDTDRAQRMVSELRQHPLPSSVSELIFRLLLALRRKDTDAINRLTVELEKESDS